MTLAPKVISVDRRPEAAMAPRGPALGLVGHSTNLVGVPTRYLASVDFNEAPVALHISGVREFNRDLFEMLDQADDETQAAEAFTLYMNAGFGLDAPPEKPRPKIGRYRSSFLSLVRGWGFDSNGPEGAVLKGWVESRFGLFPTFHKRPIRRISTDVWTDYVTEKMSSRFHNNSIHAQLDLLYEYSQYFLARFRSKARVWTLFRGVNAVQDHAYHEPCPGGGAILRMNNLFSCSQNRDLASCFGDVILKLEAPREKILFFNDLLPSHALKGEGEVLVIGGDFLVEARRL